MASTAIWHCVSCQTCTTRCPQSVDCAGVMDVLRQMSFERGKAARKLRRVLVFQKAFLDNVRRNGRLNEVELIGFFKTLAFLKDFNIPLLMKDTLLAPQLMQRGKLHVFGFRFGRFAYCTDTSVIPPASLTLLEGLEVLILDGLRRRPHPTHFNLDQAVDAAGRIGAKRTFFTHIAHELPHAATNAALPPGMALGFDGQVIEVDE